MLGLDMILCFLLCAQARAPGHMTHIGVRNVTKALLRMGHWPGADFLACMREQVRTMTSVHALVAFLLSAS